MPMARSDQVACQPVPSGTEARHMVSVPTALHDRKRGDSKTHEKPMAAPLSRKTATLRRPG